MEPFPESLEIPPGVFSPAVENRSEAEKLLATLPPESAVGYRKRFELSKEEAETGLLLKIDPREGDFLKGVTLNLPWVHVSGVALLSKWRREVVTELPELVEKLKEEKNEIAQNLTLVWPLFLFTKGIFLQVSFWGKSWKKEPFHRRVEVEYLVLHDFQKERFKKEFNPLSGSEELALHFLNMKFLIEKWVLAEIRETQRLRQEQRKRIQILKSLLEES